MYPATRLSGRRRPFRHGQLVGSRTREVQDQPLPKARLVGRIFQERLERRDYDLALVPLGSDFLHPQANAQALCNNSAWEDLNDFDGPHTLAWYCHWRDDDIMKDVAEAARAPDSSAQQQSYDKIQKKLFERGPYAFLLDEVAYVKGKGSLPVIGALDNQTRYSPLKQT